MKRCAVVSLTFFILILSTIFLRAEPLQLVHGQSVLAEGAKAILTVAYERAGVDISFQTLPRRRAVQLASVGEKDGNVMLHKAVQAQHPTLIPVGPPIVYTKTMAYFTKLPDTDMTGIRDLSDKRIVYIRGVMSHEKLAKNAQKAIDVSDIGQAFALLKTGRADIFVYGDMIETKYFEQQNWQHPIKSVMLEKHELHHFLHFKHGPVIDKLETILFDMQSSGEIETLYQKRTKELLN